jgi:hypothetical protein
MFGLTYADLAEDELSTRDIYFWGIGDEPIPTSSCATMMAAQPHRKITGPDGGAGLGANIRVNQWGFTRLFFCDETRLHQLVYQ